MTKWGTNGIGDGEFGRPRDLAIDSHGNIWVADTNNHRIQKFDSSGGFLTKWGSTGFGNGQFRSPYGVAVDKEGDVYVADSANSCIRRIEAGVVTTYATNRLSPDCTST